MTLTGLYNLKVYEYKKYGIKESPYKLLAMLLLLEIDKFEPLKSSQGDFYKKYKKEIDDKIYRLERDFNITEEEIKSMIEDNIESDDYEHDRIWSVYAEGFGALNWGLLYCRDMTPEEIYSKYFNTNELMQHYDLEQREIAYKITSTDLEKLLSKILDEPLEFYKKICKKLTTEERLFIARNLENRSCITCSNTSCELTTEEKKGIDHKGSPKGKDCSKWFNDILIGKAKVLRKTDIYDLK